MTRCGFRASIDRGSLARAAWKTARAGTTDGRPMDEYAHMPAEVGGTDADGSTQAAGESVRVVRYGVLGYVGEFASPATLELRCGQKVVVQTERGIELGEPLGVPCGRLDGALVVPRGALQVYVRNSGSEFCRPRAGRILRVATEQDIREHNHLNAHLMEDITYCAERAKALGLDLKVVTAEHLLGGERIVFYFRAPGRVDFRQLVKELAHRYHTRIEMRQVGARDEARLVADYEICGRECCCRSFLKKLRPVNMKMAKLQKSTLDPSKVSGRCGRLRCCLRYEHAGYEELVQRLPKVGSRVLTDLGAATVLDRQVLTQLVAVRTDDDRLLTIPVEEIRAFNLPPAPVSANASAPAGRDDAPASRPSEGWQRSDSASGAAAQSCPPSAASGAVAATTSPPLAAEEPAAGVASQASAFVPDGGESAVPDRAAVEAEASAPSGDQPPPAASTPARRGAATKPGRRRRGRKRRRRGGSSRPPGSSGVDKSVE